MRDASPQILELDIEKVVAGGAGLARKRGRVFLVERALPGSRVLARAASFSGKGPRAEVEAVVTHSPNACEPPCPHFETCGGCAWQHAAYPAQLAFKRDIVAEQLVRLGGLALSPGDTVPSPEPLAYRNKMEFAFGPGPTLGLRSRHDPATIVEVDRCLLMHPEAMAILDAVRVFARESGLAAYDPRRGTGVWRHVVLRRSHAEERWLVHLIVAPGAGARALRPLGEALLARFSRLRGVVLGLRAARSDYALAERRAWTLGRDALVERLCGLDFTVSAESFFQTNTAGAERLVQTLLAAVAPVPDMTAWDLYCGVGSLTLPLARAGATVDGFEANPAAVADAVANAARNGLARARFHASDILAALKSRATPPDRIVLDPPRAGLHPQAPALLAQCRVPRLVYVSCDPATLARDLARLSPAYDVESVIPVDMFPQTPHVECVAVLVRR